MQAIPIVQAQDAQEQNNQTEADDADHAAVGDDLQAVEGNVGCDGNGTRLVGGGLLQI